MPLELGQILRNRYTLTEVLTHGGMGSIYRAHGASLNYEVAVKENLFTTRRVRPMNILVQAFIMDVDGSGLTSIATTPQGDFNPAWSPDGSVIVYNASPELPRLLGQRLTDRFAQFDIAKNLRPVANVAYSRDGLWLVFEGVQDNQNHDIFIMDRNGTRVTHLTNDLGFDFQPAWRPSWDMGLFFFVEARQKESPKSGIDVLDSPLGGIATCPVFASPAHDLE